MSISSPVEDVLVGDRAGLRHLLRRHLAPHLALQERHRLERMLDRLLADHQAEARQVAADHVVERAMAGMALDVLEQQRGRLLAADQVGDGGGLEIRVDLRRDALELAHLFDLVEPGVEIARVRRALARVGRIRRRRAAVGLYRHIHVHRRPLARLRVHGAAMVDGQKVGRQPGAAGIG